MIIAPAQTQPAPSPYQEKAGLERELAHDAPTALRMLPAAGYRDGAAGIFKATHLQIVPGTESAWCTGAPIGNMAAGCYVQFTFTDATHISKAMPAECGMIGRWRAPVDRPTAFAPDSGGARWIAKGDPALLQRRVADDWRMCNSGT